MWNFNKKKEEDAIKKMEDNLLNKAMYDSSWRSLVDEQIKKAIVPEPVPFEKPKEDWIWVEGYKGTNKDMTCRDVQFEFGKQYDMPEDAKIVDCECGYHLCLKLNDVFCYYPIGEGHRFFKVRALVRKADVAEYGVEKERDDKYLNPWFISKTYTRNKLAAKSIQFISECSMDEIFDAADGDYSTWSKEIKQLAIDTGIGTAMARLKALNLTEFGYSLPFAELIVKRDRYDVAYAVSTQKDLSMDMKAAIILLEG